MNSPHQILCPDPECPVCKLILDLSLMCPDPAAARDPIYQALSGSEPKPINIAEFRQRNERRHARSLDILRNPQNALAKPAEKQLALFAVNEARA